MKNKTIFNIVFSGISIGLAFTFPFITGPSLAPVFLPMHIPVLICGFVCGWKYGLVVGATSPLLRSIIIGQPNITHVAIRMSFELATYGFLCGLLFSLFKKTKLNSIVSIYLTLIIAMLGGRIVWGGVSWLQVLVDQKLTFNFHIFLAGAFIDAWPGIILQIVLIPALMIALEKTHALKTFDE